MVVDCYLEKINKKQPVGHYATRKRSPVYTQYTATSRDYTRILTEDRRRNEGGFICGRKELNLLVLGSRVMFDANTINRELDTVAFELLTVGDRVHRGGVLVQKVDLFE